MLWGYLSNVLCCVSILGKSVMRYHGVNLVCEVFLLVPV